MLTIVGYSINDTIVVFDRVRENQRHMKRGDFIGVVDLSVSQTISRSINTSITTFVMIFVLYIVGVASIEEFALPLMVGILSGTYSSIFIASPLWFMLKKKEEVKIQTAQKATK
jgi:preprotein translocase SecF subunit